MTKHKYLSHRRSQRADDSSILGSDTE